MAEAKEKTAAVAKVKEKGKARAEAKAREKDRVEMKVRYVDQVFLFQHHCRHRVSLSYLIIISRIRPFFTMESIPSDPPKCVCNGVTEFRFVNPQQLIELASSRLRNIAGANINTGSTNPFDFLTYSLAHSLAPPNCQLASVETEQDLMRLLEVGQSAPGWVGAFKDLESAFEDQNSTDVSVRRDGWINVDGSSVDPMVWADNEPELIMSTDTTLIEYVAILTSDGLVSSIPSETDLALVQGAYYECCAEVLPSCFGSGLESLEDVLLPLIQSNAGPPPPNNNGGGGPNPGEPMIPVDPMIPGGPGSSGRRRG